MLDLGQIFRNFTTWTTVTWVSTMLVARVFDFHKAYTMIIDKLDKEKWLMEQCLSDEFYHRLAYHSDLCEVTKLKTTTCAVYAIYPWLRQKSIAIVK